MTSIERGQCGGSPETTLLVVNGDSPLSLLVANEYVKLRDIPHTHIVWLHGIPSLTTITVDDFRTRIWGPIQDFILEHDLTDEIDLIAYSADFPYQVSFRADLKSLKIKPKPPISRGASLTGLTFFIHQVQRKQVRYLVPRTNPYFRYDYSRIDYARKPWTDQQKKLLSEGNKALKAKDLEIARTRFMSYLHQRPEHGAAWYQLATIYALQLNYTKAIETLTRAIEQGYFDVLHVQRDKTWDTLREHPRFEKLVKAMWKDDVGFLPPLGFKHQHYSWALRTGSMSLFRPTAHIPDHFYLSMMLAYTGQRGNNIDEILTYLRLGASSDGTHPEGTVYLMENQNVRSITRQPFFPATVTALAGLDKKVEILARGRDGQNGIIPVHRKDIIGIVAGTKSFRWLKAKSKFLPGAIAETLTSYGAKFGSRKQTKLTEFLRYGAVASSGAVAEPFAVQEKFPVPYLHVFYAAGCSVAEAFYQSLATPYQLLIVGDPLARPFANFSEVEFDDPGVLTVKGIVDVSVEINSLSGTRKLIELWVDGKRARIFNKGDKITWNTEAFNDGYHQLRVVTEDSDLVATRSYGSVWRRIANHSFEPVITDHDKSVALDGWISVHGFAPGAESVEIRQGHRVLDRKQLHGSAWKIKVSARPLGIGTVFLTVKTIYPKNLSYTGRPLKIEVNPPKALVNRVFFQSYQKGLLAKVTDEKFQTHQLVLHPKNNGYIEVKKALENLKIQVPFQKAELTGEFYVNQSGFYQLDVNTDGEINIVVDGNLVQPLTVYRVDKMVFFPMTLKKGWHRLALTLKGKFNPRLSLLLAGTSVAVPFTDKIVRYARFGG